MVGVDRTWEIDEPKASEIGGVGEPLKAVAVTLVSGRLDIVSHGGQGSARYEVHEVAGRPLAASFAGGTLRLEQHKDPRGQLLETLKGFLGGNRHVTARITLTVPTGTRVQVNTVSADVLVGGVGGDVTVNTVSGALSLTRLSGRIDAKTVSSNVDAGQLSGELKSKTVSGRLTVDDSTLRSAKIATVSGAVLLDLRGGSSLVTVNGVSSDVTVRIPAGAGYDVSATSTSGHVVVDGQTLSGGTSGEKGGHRSEGDRHFAMKARTVSGNIVVLRGEPTSTGTVFGSDAGYLEGDVQDVRPSQRASGGATPQDEPPADRPGPFGSA